MKQKTLRLLAGITLATFFGPVGLAFAVALLVIGNFNGSLGTTAQPAINGTSVADVLSTSAEGQEVLYKKLVFEGVVQSSPVYDNMIGGIGSGKPWIDHTDTTKVAGSTIVIPTLAPMSASSGVQGGGVRVGMEQKIRPGDFTLTVGRKWWGVGMLNTARTETVIGQQWDSISPKLLGPIVSRACTYDMLGVLRGSATSDNIVYPNGKTLDTLGSADTFSTGLILKTATQMKRLGALAVMVTKGKNGKPDIQRYIDFTTNDLATPIKSDPRMINSLNLAGVRGNENPLFTGEYIDWDGHIVYPWQTIISAAYDSIGCPLQPEAFLGTAIVSKGSSTSMPSGLDGGGSEAAVAATPYNNYFENFSLYPRVCINGLTVTVGTGTRYFAIQNKSDGKIALFSFTTNTAAVADSGKNQLGGLTRLGSTITGDYNTTIGSMTWNSGAWLAAGDGDQFPGLTEGALDVGSLIVEVNAKGQPIGEGLMLGQMAGVCGWGRLTNGKTMGGKTSYESPHGQSFAEGYEIAFGSAAFKRADSKLPNFVRQVFARAIDGFPVIS